MKNEIRKTFSHIFYYCRCKAGPWSLRSWPLSSTLERLVQSHFSGIFHLLKRKGRRKKGIERSRILWQCEDGHFVPVQSGLGESSGKTSLGFCGGFIWKFILLQAGLSAWAFIFSVKLLILYKTWHKSWLCSPCYPSGADCKRRAGLNEQLLGKGGKKKSPGGLPWLSVLRYAGPLRGVNTSSGKTGAHLFWPGTGEMDVTRAPQTGTQKCRSR